MYSYLNNEMDYKNNDLEKKKMNLLVGSNNSGKSRLMRSELKKSNKDYNLSFNDYEIWKNQTLVLLDISVSLSKKNGGSYSMGDDSQKASKIHSMVSEINQILEKKEIDSVITSKFNEYNRDNRYDRDEQIKSLDVLKKNIQKLKTQRNTQKMYIPVLRGLRTLEKNKNHYGERTKKDYFKDDGVVEIFTGLELYDRLQDMLLGEYEERKKVREFEGFLSENFFENKKVSLIPKKIDDVVHIKIGEDKDFPIYNLGDGIQSIIILTFPLFEKKGKSILIGIEEPEVYLHPGMQRKLMEVLLDKEGKYGFENFQYLITTHSNHFLDLTLDYPDDVIIHESRKLDDGKFELTRKNDENMLELMGNIGVRNSSVFLANSTIWIEGITDRLYLRKYLEVYQNEKLMSKEISKIYEEDKHYSFIEYSGGNITHWDFLDEEEGMTSQKISNKIFLLADTDGMRGIENKDGTPHKKAERIEILEKSKDINAYLLKCKEIENLLTPNIIKKILDQKGEKIDGLEFEQDDYKEVGIGKYIETTLLKRTEGKKKYEEKSGTIKSKVDFCRLACENIENLDDLSKETKLICEKLYSFIEEANK